MNKAFLRIDVGLRLDHDLDNEPINSDYYVKCFMDMDRKFSGIGTLYKNWEDIDFNSFPSHVNSRIKDPWLVGIFVIKEPRSNKEEAKFEYMAVDQLIYWAYKEQNLYD